MANRPLRTARPTNSDDTFDITRNFPCTLTPPGDTLQLATRRLGLFVPESATTRSRCYVEVTLDDSAARERAHRQVEPLGECCTNVTTVSVKIELLSGARRDAKLCSLGGDGQPFPSQRHRSAARSLTALQNAVAHLNRYDCFISLFPFSKAMRFNTLATRAIHL